MTLRATGVGSGALALVSTFAQPTVPGLALYHTWQYALALALVLTAASVYAVQALRGRDGRLGRRLALAVTGAGLVGLAGLGSGLLGPDTAEIVGPPGTVVPIPSARVAAFFPPADAVAIAHGGLDVLVRRRGRDDVTVGRARHPVAGESVLFLADRPAAYVEAWDAHGAHLTVTQPTGTAFLSPVLLFRDRQRIGALDVPFDTFGVPAQHRVVHALYFTPSQLASFGHAGLTASAPALVLSVADDRGRPLGIGLAQSGESLTLGGVRVRATIGTYPALELAAAPSMWLVGSGIALLLAGIAWTASGLRGGAPAIDAEQSLISTTPEAATGGEASVPTT